MNIYKTEPGSTNLGTVTYIEDDYPERLNPLGASTVFAWDYLGSTCSDGLMAVNPWTHRDEPWLATAWSYVQTGGDTMDFTFDLRLNDLHGSPITWADGKAISINDIPFTFGFLHDYQIATWWGAFRYYGSTTIVDADSFTVHWNQVSSWDIYNIAAAAYLLPPQVWTVDPRDGLAWTGNLEITSFDPSALAYPTAYNTAPGPIALPTQVFGVAPFNLLHSTNFQTVNGYGDMAANRNYWLTTDDIRATIADWFHRSGDVDSNAVVNISDLDLISANYAMTVPPADPRCDITGPAGSPPDSKIDIDDLATTGKYFGETETVLP
jgi:hypothetical protein